MATISTKRVREEENIYSNPRASKSQCWQFLGFTKNLEGKRNEGIVACRLCRKVYKNNGK